MESFVDWRWSSWKNLHNLNENRKWMKIIERKNSHWIFLYGNFCLRGLLWFFGWINFFFEGMFASFSKNFHNPQKSCFNFFCLGKFVLNFQNLKVQKVFLVGKFALIGNSLKLKTKLRLKMAIFNTPSSKQTLWENRKNLIWGVTKV